MINWYYNILGFTFRLWVWINLGEKKAKYHYQVPFFFLVKFRSKIPFSIGVVKKIYHKDKTKNEGIFQLIHRQVFQRRCKII